MQNEKLSHAGVPGMKWGVRKNRESGGSGGGKRRFVTKSLIKNMDGRKVNKLFGKRNRTKARQFIFGNEKKWLKNSVYKKKYNSLDAAGKKKAEEKTRKAMVVVGLASIGAMAYMLKNA